MAQVTTLNKLAASVVLHTAAPFTLLNLITTTISGVQSLSQAARLYNYQQYPMHTPCQSYTMYNYQQYPVHITCHKLHTLQLSTISGVQSLSQAAYCTIINNIRFTVLVTSSTMYNYQQYPVHSPCHKLHTVKVSTISGAEPLLQAPHCTVNNNIRCTVPVTSSTLQLSTISSAQALSQAAQCTIINNIRCTVHVTSCTLYNYQQYPVHSTCRKLHTVQLSTISGTQSLSQAPHCTIITIIRCTVHGTS